MPPACHAYALDFDRHLRRLVWAGAAVIAIAAAIVYAGKAADERSAFIRWRPQVLDFMRGVTIYDKSMFLLRPDMHIAWRGDKSRAKVATLVDRVTGRNRP